MLRLGASPRSMLQLLRAAKATAALEGRDFVLPDDVVSVAEAVLAHRIILDRKAASTGETPQSVIRAVLAKIPVSPEMAAAPAPAAGPAAGLRRRQPRRPPHCRTAAREWSAVALMDRFPRHIFSTRGWGLLGAGAVFLLAAQVMGRRDLLTLAVLLLVLPLLVAGRNPGAEAEVPGLPGVQPRQRRNGRHAPRSGWPSPGPARDPATPSWRSACPPGSANPRCSGSRRVRPPAGPAAMSTICAPAKRGQFLIGPVTAEFSDPFGLSLHRHAIDDGDILTVTPAAVELPVTGLAGARGTRRRHRHADPGQPERRRRHDPRIPPR